MIDIEVDRTLGRDMLDILREVRLIRLRNGALQLAIARRPRSSKHLPRGNDVTCRERD
jgi:hypothetical protein